MASVKQHLTVSKPFGNHREMVRVVYDFDVDGGATGALDLFTADGAVVVTHAHLSVLTAATSGGSATVKWGVTGDDDRFADTTQGAVANLTAGAVILPPVVEGTPNVIAAPYKMASGDKVLMTIGTAALTAGKIEFVLEYVKA